jgi:hypothetical protein
MPGSVSSLDSDLSRHHSDDGYDSDEEYLLAQREWEESLEQLQELVSIVVLPYLGRFLGRKWSYWRTFASHLALQPSGLILLQYSLATHGWVWAGHSSSGLPLSSLLDGRHDGVF